uniref:T-cell immunomodulatory protein n=1 Tax=Bursaphelenchus xylophilus TaxID=6326 RepID=A0A1I7SUA0_BURXY
MNLLSLILFSWISPLTGGVSLTIGDDHVPDPQLGRICAYGDVNKDRYTDLIVQKSEKLVFLLQSEEGKFKSSQRHGPIDLNVKKDVFCATGDFNGDAALDVMVITPNGDGEDFDVVVYLNREGSFQMLPNPITQKFVEPPAVMDVNGDGISDILGMVKKSGDVHYSLHCLSGSRSATFEECQNKFRGGDFSPGPYPYFPHIFVDLDGDLSAEIVFGMKNSKVPLKFMVFKRMGSSQWNVKSDLVPDLPDSPELQEFAAPLIADFNSDSKIDIVLPVCRAKNDCTHIDKFLVWFDGMVKWEQFQMDMKELAFVVEPNSKTVFRVGEFKLDGYPDLIATSVYTNNRKTETRAPLIVSNEPGDGNFSRKFEFNLQKDLHLVLPEAIAGANISASSFFDLKEDGNLDVLVEYKDKHVGGTMIDFIKCDDKGDTTFLKVQIFSNVCSNDCPGTPSSDSGSGIAWSGACVSYSMDTSYGRPQVAVQCQLPQTTYRTLHAPFVLFGLGRSPNFVDIVTLGSPRDPERKENQQHILKQIVPNSRVIVVPPERDEAHWQSRLYLTPSTLIIQSLMVQVTVCLILLGLVVGLHMRERRHDRRERQSQSHRFHFDAM